MEAYLGIDEITGVLFQRLKGKGCKIHGDGSANQSELKQECDFILFHNLFCIRRVKKKLLWNIARLTRIRFVSSINGRLERIR